MGPNQIYQENGTLWLYIGSEPRDGQPMHHFVGSKGEGVAWHRWFSELPDGFELVNDTEGRAEAHVFQLEVQALQTERNYLNEIMRQAVEMLPDHEAERLRKSFLKKMETVELKSR